MNSTIARIIELVNESKASMRASGEARIADGKMTQEQFESRWAKIAGKHDDAIIALHELNEKNPEAASCLRELDAIQHTPEKITTHIERLLGRA